MIPSKATKNSEQTTEKMQWKGLRESDSIDDSADESSNEE
jgi:hypothetical protein